MKTTTNRRRGGFTMVELLVVIAVILVLIAMMFPNIRQGIEKARLVACMNNIGQIMKAAATYSAENRSRVPSPNWGYGGSEKGWLYSNGQMDTQRDLATGTLYPYLKGPAVYRCPADRQPDFRNPYAVPWRPKNSRMITSYCANGSFAQYSKLGFNNELQMYNVFKLEQFDGADVMFWEPWEGVDKQGWWWDGSNYPNEGVTARHNERFAKDITKANARTSVACADGHVELMDVRVYYQLAAKGTRNRLWNTPGTANGR